MNRDPQELIEFVENNIFEKEKITLDTRLSDWFGQQPNGEKVAITEDALEDLVVHDPKLVEDCNERNFVVMPDGTKLGCTIRVIRDNGMFELANELSAFAGMQNRRAGFEDFDPETP